MPTLRLGPCSIGSVLAAADQRVSQYRKIDRHLLLERRQQNRPPPKPASALASQPLADTTQ